MEWVIRLRGLPVSADPPYAPGVVLIQIDGFSRKRLEEELQRGSMPFLRRLLDRERYALHTFYSGLPSNTPAVQAELFYGVKGCVPAFCFLDQEAGKVFRMYDPESARLIEDRLQEGREGLLAGGSSYANIFTGGAAESHVCASSFKWRSLLWAGNPWTHFVHTLLYPDLLIRGFLLGSVETLLAAFDALRGIGGGKESWPELQFISTRIGPVFLLRELVVMGACIDAARGLPIVHLNFVGYDDHAHRRGPRSGFATWPLKGIDDAIKRVWYAAHRSRRRDYDVWIYSDHGQEKTVPYPHTAGRTLAQAVTAVCKDVLAEHTVIEEMWAEHEQDEHVYSRMAVRLVPTSAKEEAAEKALPKITVAAMGPIGHLYPERPLEEAVLEEMAKRLTGACDVPVAFRVGHDGQIKAWTKDGMFRLPEDAAKVLGEDHPFLPQATEDLIRILKHPSAGALVLTGWHVGRQPLSFPVEHGAHAGFGWEETSAFAMLPMDAPVDEAVPGTMRPVELREAALRRLGRVKMPPAVRKRQRSSKLIRVMTYNIHSCVGLDGRCAPERIARVITRYEPDIIALQEVDAGLARSANVHQAEWLATRLAMTHHFGPVISFTEGHYGNALLSAYPMQVRRDRRLPALGGRSTLEPRGALWVQVQVDELAVQVINCHLSIWPYERFLQAKAVMGPEWAEAAQKAGPVLVLGDFNAVPRSAAYRVMTKGLRDAQTMLEKHKQLHTLPSRYPVSRVDHVFLGPKIEVVSIAVPRTRLDEMASDHLPLIVDLRVLP